MTRKWLPRMLLFGGAAIAGLMMACAMTRPSNDRVWSEDQAILPFAEIEGNEVTIRNIRNFRYEPEGRQRAAYYDRTFDLRQLESVWFIVVPFGSIEGIAHTFVSFGFGPQGYVAISAEIRKEQGETYSPLRGLLRQYELMYVIGDERDLIQLRTHVHKDDVHLYPVRTDPAKMRTMFLEMIERANKLAREPEFYNTVTNSCTMNLVRHVNTISPRRVPFSYRVLLPGYSDSLALELGLIDTDVPLDELRKRFRINERAERFADDPEFSARIRER